MAVLTLMYHDVIAGDPDASGFPGPGANHYKLSLSRFEAHLATIEASGLRPSLVGKETGKPTLFLTFDDGGCSAATETAPALERRGWCGHFFVPTDRIGASGFLDREQIRRLHDAGHLVGSHGCTHRPLTTLADAEVLREWSKSRADLEDLLEASVAVASVPRGAYSARIGRLAAQAGYRHLFTSEPWLEPRRVGSALVYGRFAVLARTSAARVTALCSLSPLVVRWVATNWYARKATKRVLGPVYDPLRRRILARIG
jgi:peptidoglycan/xylan/chitin deacetylase (PgdA/CDA1 family)